MDALVALTKTLSLQMQNAEPGESEEVPLAIVRTEDMVWVRVHEREWTDPQVDGIFSCPQSKNK